ncbi:XRE family transcriptional regulator [Cypionkella aquatica]|uniref:XRE family transcriptional regulator n=1 Tax=Cypionkella aquatica TaxID=1756042 RepID=A0AA37U2K0_9RHOB|nr:helix-turn-helix transcriptional regulator [Cypionkella aquatica]GLS88302.1 XRE family transcriptional regulator [Cypionkella aquatica]
MPSFIDKRDRAPLFRERLAQAMAQNGISQAALARKTGADRSTISALLGAGTRLPNAQLTADCAMALGVSCDWLLGLSRRPEPIDELLAASVTLAEAPRALFDQEMIGWHHAAAGYKIRHVPASLPDMLKTPEVVAWEYADHLGRSADQAIVAFQDQLAWMKTAQSDYEIAMPMHEISNFARGLGYWSGLPLSARHAQMDHLIAICDTLYPSLRMYLFDAHRVYSSPVTVFGPHLAAVYLGRHYIVFRDPARVQSILQHFDGLVRAAPFSARAVRDHLARLQRAMDQ